MVNKIRKKDGSLKYPYDSIMSIVDANIFIEKLKKCSACRYVSREAKAYGVFVGASSKDNTGFEDMLTLVKKYNVKHRIADNGFLYISSYIAYSEFDKEV